MGLLFQINKKLVESANSDPITKLQLRQDIVSDLTHLYDKPYSESRSGDVQKKCWQDIDKNKINHFEGAVSKVVSTLDRGLTLNKNVRKHGK
ncbi:hypothetical protein, partial [Paenibacillus sp. FSL A5-0031]|uniref:hypothetical protein n=1 Tax=Paenibacillus sp. FSL A5-0031 TaxID=1920420 RepID=UPI001C4C9EF2